MTLKVQNMNITSLVASKLTGALPAVNGAAVTNLPGIDTGAGDPTETTNSTLGTHYINSTTGAMFCCTDATTNANVWVHSGGFREKCFGGNGVGRTRGYIAGGGDNVGGGYPPIASIEKFNFASGSSTSGHGSLRVAVYASQCGVSSSSHGFVLGGIPLSTSVEKFSFASSGQQTTHGTISSTNFPNLYSASGSTSHTKGYHAGGHIGGYTSKIGWIDLTSEAEGGEHGNLSSGYQPSYGSGHSSHTHGYASGGANGPLFTKINKYAFASNVTATNISSLTTARRLGAGTSSETNGYIAGGIGSTPSRFSGIEKFSFSSDGNSVTRGDFFNGRTSGGAAGMSSETHGYAAGGHNGSAYLTDINRWANASDVVGTDWGDLGTARENAAGHQF
jgi:hypothetical protein|tara:strand:+ start:2532 stop:3704 length:1173 start_codon:yes stop_codon:yes gene_type:complete